MRTLFVGLLVLIAAAVTGQKDEPHPGYSPTVLLASASEQKGKVLIHLSQSGPMVPSVDGTDPPESRPGTQWVSLRDVTLGEQVQAFGVNGKRVDQKAVLRVLAKPRGVAVFLRSYPSDPMTPPAFYRDVFRDGTLLLVLKHEDLYNPKP